MSKNIYVTQPSLPPLDEYVALLEEIWDTGILTHNGPMVRNLESQLCEKLALSNLSLVTNGTIALQMAMKALDLKGEVITTPFSWIATVSAIKWEHCTPVFCDIDEDTFNIDVDKIEDLINENTVAIMPVHVFGAACDIERIEAIAAKHGLKVIYDAAHALGSTYKGKSLLSYGDVSATSLHGTKLFNTAEGGACIAKTDSLHERINRIRFFGHDESRDIVEDGFNGKMTEVHAALGLANLKYFDDVLKDRKSKYHLYMDTLSGVQGLTYQAIKFGECNYSYFPIVFENEDVLLNVMAALNSNDIYPRRYFYPSLNTFEKVVSKQAAPVSESLSKRILCLPLYKGLQVSDIQTICQIVKAAM
ncbi:DegT/DnrJ/EryC1/StrS family aminotransferase [Ferrimonas aestuarii]|uniref:DegT/DnrJ/EryC1/StrS family aminotransferase n=1 Tax=Ferrimonas aestuarii TaxID=2569539 RepID=A0A4U1BLY3_9GAMM|nr:DegT/DnrJ/EryC1/StrS family aminotransferase [Ferrimonas aestuarii]TKB53966.1 DegT/DnrJ/EryC1/StrS family aminotransferase [Ferrimonas aestuarii]